MSTNMIPKPEKLKALHRTGLLCHTGRGKKIFILHTEVLIEPFRPNLEFRNYMRWWLDKIDRFILDLRLSRWWL
jgi:hypothetical protein